ncbi:lactate racemase domain-containing protein [Halocella sp. SP3-1]|uniref:lactate racemase domain-containing protein n=1 Tax=Halocella sp. SP3-1 TaxID=2382161 RepID=UPI000F764ECD|nr:lactate racemase domain-containing protein [Halocella sp. SP3-1]AZO93776.1 DUF2088 domain-containing protein [Halocella sp. SP3-1]
MENLIKKVPESSQFSYEEQKSYIKQLVDQIPEDAKRILIIPPDITRKHSGAGVLTSIFYDFLRQMDIEIDIMPALGTHDPMENGKLKEMFGTGIPMEVFKTHDWRNDTIKIGEIPAEYVSEVTEDKVKQPIPVKVNECLIKGGYDLIISIGQVVPHEVVGMANYSKNILVGVGGFEIISVSHFVGAVAGVENVMGRDHSPARKLYDYAQEHFLKDIPLLYILTVNSTDIDEESELTRMLGIFTGYDRSVFERAVEFSQKVNIIKVEKSLNKVVVYLDPEEFKTTWIGCKAVYRTRMAIADGGELVIIAPGLHKFGEDINNDRLIRKYGYVGTEKVLDLVKENSDLQENLSAAAHLIQGSSEGRFKINFACQHLRKQDIEGVNFNYLPLDRVLEKYNINELDSGLNIVDGEEIFYINNPATGLWVAKDKF